MWRGIGTQRSIVAGDHHGGTRTQRSLVAGDLNIVNQRNQGMLCGAGGTNVAEINERYVGQEEKIWRGIGTQ